MVVKRKPVSVDQFIQEGGSVSLGADGAKEAEKIKGLKLRLPANLLSEVDAVVLCRRPSPSRHQWILEAIYEKLLRETPEEIT